MGRPTCQLPHAHITHGGFGVQSDPAAPRAHPYAPTESWPAPRATPRDSLSFRLCFQQQPLTCPTSHVCAPIFQGFLLALEVTRALWVNGPPSPLLSLPRHTSPPLLGSVESQRANLSNAGVKAHGPQRAQKGIKVFLQTQPPSWGCLTWVVRGML